MLSKNEVHKRLTELEQAEPHGLPKHKQGPNGLSSLFKKSTKPDPLIVAEKTEKE